MGMQKILTDLKKYGVEELKTLQARQDELLKRWRYPLPTPGKYPHFQDPKRLRVLPVGPSGSGKSSLDRKLLQHYGVDERIWRAIAVGEKETTREISGFPIGEFGVLYDIPGEGTVNERGGPNHENYLQNWNIMCFDVVFLMSSTRVRNMVVDVAKELHKYNRKCFAIRTKVDEDIINARRNARVNNRPFSIKQKLDELRADTKTLMNGCVEDDNIFLIGNKEELEDFGLADLNFEKLCNALEKLAVEKQLAVERQQSPGTGVKRSIEEVEDALESPAKRVALAVA